jgi:K+-transporting ATPase ATPase A chain
MARGIYRPAGIDPTADMDWKRYAQSFVVFGLGGTVLLYVVLRIQPFLHRFDPAYLPVRRTHSAGTVLGPPCGFSLS